MDELVQLSDLIKDISRIAIDHQRSDGSLPPGHNGSYHDSETPVRNTSHWVIIFIDMYEKTGEKLFLEAAENAIAYLRTDEVRPHDATFHHRMVDDKDRCNGLIGQAWTIESLVMAEEKLKRGDLVALAEEVFLLHPFDNHLGLWHQVEIDGTVLSIDATFNHQLWFAAVGGLLAQHPEVSRTINQRVIAFLNRLERNIQTTSSGLIYHRSLPNFAPGTAYNLAKRDQKLFVLSMLEWTQLVNNRLLRAFLNSQFSPGRRAPLIGQQHINKSIGYHQFNLYALALLYQCYPDHNFWLSETFSLILSYIQTDEYRSGLEGNKYGYPYNPPGFEVPFALETFHGEETREQQKNWLERQLNKCYNPDTKMLDRNNPDSETLTARIYEATRLPDLEIAIDHAL